MISHNVGLPLLQAIDSFKSKKILVIGDLILDQYTWGSVERVSPEAPIPILNARKSEYKLGGAACVMANVKALECEVLPVGLIGNDGSGQTFLRILEEHGISNDGIFCVPDFSTIVKNRLLTNQQQLLRVDYETKYHLPESLESKIIEYLRVNIPLCDGVIISDYKKGLLTPAILKLTIEIARACHLPTVCDPGKGVLVENYQGVTTIKPNRSEAEKIYGYHLSSELDILQAARMIKEFAKADFVSLSLDKDGILFYQDPENHHFFRTNSLEVYDVTGAGDMVISVLGVLLADKQQPAIAIQVANFAAGLEISYLGAVNLKWNQIRKKISGESISSKLVTVKELEEIHRQKTEVASPHVFTNGYFDDISSVHLRFLIELKRFDGYVTVALNSDQAIFRKRGSLPLLNQWERARLVAGIESISWVLIFEEDTAAEIIQCLQPDILVKGMEHRDREFPEKEAMLSLGKTITFIEIPDNS